METPPSIHLHIDRVILDGLPFATTDAASIHTALETEIARILGETFLDMPRTSVALDRLPDLQLALNAATAPASLGRELATVLGASLAEALPAPPSANAP